ncbi:MAG: fibronectin type III domain-containing protein [Lachnospiraceae bacterium]|nr:fibronectin type III domain-containing protein [Lachnospiraceae bacterium]
MRNLTFLSVMIFLLIGIKSFAQSWSLNVPDRNSINVMLVDSITYGSVEGRFTESIWRDGKVFSNRTPSYGEELTLNEEELCYQYATMEEDGVDAVVTGNGLFAILKPLENGGYIYVDGIVGETNTEQMLFDENGLFKAIYIDGIGSLCAFYTEESLILYDEIGNIFSIIPFKDLMSETDDIEQRVISRATVITRNPIYKTLKLRSTIKDFIKKPIKSTTKALLQYILSQEAGRYGDMINDFVDLVIDNTDILSWLQSLERMQEIFFFGNTSLKTLPAKERSLTNYDLSCEVIASSESVPLFNQPNIHINNCTHTLKMTLRPSSIISNDSKQQKEKQISSAGTETFSFNVMDLEALYYYEPSLTINVNAQIITELPIFNFLIISPTIPLILPFDVSCTIYGEELDFATGGVNSNVISVENVEITSADVICSFSECPEGAICQILVTSIGSDLTMIFNGEPNKDQQTVKVSGLTPLTDYSVESRIMYKDIPYWSSSNVCFKTTGPSGGVISIDYDNVTTNSAVVTCKFTGVGAGVECGIIVEGEDGQSQTIAANNTEEEQDITISGLEPGTKYTCYGFVKLTHSNGTYYHQESNGLSFTTKIPGISGTWNVVETYSTRPFPGAEWETKTREYTLHLNTDGSVNVEGLGYDYIGGSWGYGNGRFGATCHVIATQTQNSWDRYEGVVDDIKNPQKITGTRYVGNMNQVTNVENAAGSIVMTR